MMWCTVAYKASPNNYAWYGFEKLTQDQRRSYMTHGDSEKLIARYNETESRDLLEDKISFARTFNEYFGRDWISIKEASREDFRTFIAGKNEIIAKPLDEGQGRGIEKLVVNDYASLDELFDYLKSRDEFGIVEEFVSQHEALNAVYAGAVAVIRLVTIVKDDRVDVVNAAVTFGNGDYVANLWRGGLYCAVDEATGVVRFPAVDKNGKVYERHPATGHPFTGLLVPCWDEVLALVRGASRVVPSVRYVGWDLAITREGPILIEGNTSPGYSALQSPVFMRDGFGLKPRFAEYLSN